MSSVLLRKTLNPAGAEGRETHYVTTVSRKYDADTDLDPSMEIGWWAPEVFWQLTCHGGRRNSCCSYLWKRWQWRELSLAEGSRSLWRSHEASGWCCQGKLWHHQMWQQAKLLIQHVLEQRRGSLGAGGHAQCVSDMWMHTCPHTDTYLCPPRAWHPMARAWDSNIYVQPGCDKHVLIQ